jgi:hypothetical protein
MKHWNSQGFVYEKGVTVFYNYILNMYFSSFLVAGISCFNIYYFGKVLMLFLPPLKQGRPTTLNLWSFHQIEWLRLQRYDGPCLGPPDPRGRGMGSNPCYEPFPHWGVSLCQISLRLVHFHSRYTHAHTHKHTNIDFYIRLFWQSF